MKSDTERLVAWGSVLKCHKVVTVGLRCYKNKTCHGRFHLHRQLILKSPVWHTPINCGGLAGISENQRRHADHILFLDYIKSVVTR